MSESSLIEPYRVIPLSPMRKIIAARMTDAKQSIPHFRVAAEFDMDALMALRQEVNADNATRESATLSSDNDLIKAPTKVSLNDFIIKACATALIEVPAINIQLVGNDIHRYSQADISVVVSVKDGLSTPIVRNANTKSVQDIAQEVKDLAAHAAIGKLQMDEILGGSFSVSNLGMYGIDQFDAIINPPQAAILAIGSAKPKPVVRNGTVSIATVMRVQLSLDHRAIDGAQGAEFLAALGHHIQHPDGLLK